MDILANGHSCRLKKCNILHYQVDISGFYETYCFTVFIECCIIHFSLPKMNLENPL